jgi:hypothetical protein
MFDAHIWVKNFLYQYKHYLVLDFDPYDLNSRTGNRKKKIPEQ